MTKKLNAKDFEVRANIIFDQLGIKKPERLIPAQIFQQINPALQSLTPREVQGYSKTLAAKIKHGSGDQKAYAKYLFAEAALMARVIQGQSANSEVVCNQIKQGSDAAYRLIPEDQRGLDPEQAHGIPVLFAELSGVSAIQNNWLNLYNGMTKSCQGALTFIGRAVKKDWSASFQGLMGCFNHLDNCVDPTTLAQRK